MYLVTNAQGFDYEIKVACANTATNALRFTCRVDAASPGHPLNSWDETVTCAPSWMSEEHIPRCTSASGYALQ